MLNTSAFSKMHSMLNDHFITKDGEQLKVLIPINHLVTKANLMTTDHCIILSFSHVIQ